MERRPQLILACTAAVTIILIIASMACPVKGQGNSNLDVEIAPGYESIDSDDSLLFTIKIFNLAQAGRVDLGIETAISDMEGSVLVSKSETVAVETQASFVRTLVLPEDTKPGRYRISVKLTYPDQRFSLSEKYFELKADEDNKTILAVITGLVLAIAILVFTAIRLRGTIAKWMIRLKIHRTVRKMMSGK